MPYSQGLPTCWCHSLILAYMSENSRCLHTILLGILLYLANQGKSLHLSFIVMYDRTPKTLLLSLTCLNIPTDKTITQSSWFDLHPGHFLTWERPLDTTSGIFPRYSSATSSQLTVSSHYRYNAEWAIMNSSPKTPASGGRPFCYSGGVWTFVHCWISFMSPL